MIDLTTPPVIRYGRERSKTARWTGEDIGDKTLCGDLTVSHDGNRKCFRVYFTRGLASSGNGFSVFEFQPFRDIARLYTVPCARYSAKALEAAFTDAISGGIIEEYPVIAPLLVAAD